MNNPDIYLLYSKVVNEYEKVISNGLIFVSKNASVLRVSKSLAIKVNIHVESETEFITSTPIIICK